MSYDYLIVGAGLSGLVLAERLCTQLGKKCLVVEKRNHIGGICYDETDKNGVLIHRYGPHYFRTNSDTIRAYLSQFTDWMDAQYVIKSFIDGKYWSFPINLHTFEELIGRESTTVEFKQWLEERRVRIAVHKNSEDVILARVGVELYEKFFKGYTRKQWNKDPSELDPSVCGRIPIRLNRNDSYCNARFQAIPKDGYTMMFNRLIEACGHRLKLELATDYRDVKDVGRFDHVIYTGRVDEYFHFCYGPLEYRSLRFETESFTAEELRRLGKRDHWQPYLQVNYPNGEGFTRIVEVKHITRQRTPHTAIVREYPADCGGNSDPYYPVPTTRNQMLYCRYQELAKQEPKVTFVGRLATYRYYNMDQVVGMALSVFKKKFAVTTSGYSILDEWTPNTSTLSTNVS